MTQLQHLVLDLPDYNFIEQLLPVLAGLTQLRHLYLDYLDPVAAHFHAMDELEWDESDERDVNAQACAELTASTQLTHLAVRGYLLTFAGGLCLANIWDLLAYGPGGPGYPARLRQLLEQHSTDGAYLRELMDEQRQAAAQQQEQLQQAQQQLQEAQQQLQQAQDTIAELQAQLAGGGQQQPA
ncbi:hypothetical protein OEZ85_006591 [Tetradesmus obliquus]|uniref:F-box domain-containing protein n=1 Tax=Tetradesmus obliquus TaxID=3088 RepID=A0ABY8TVT5_TETOB|nr:hypothetical protein OEZ85_006591 [Tetradesmus obliquus]